MKIATWNVNSIRSRLSHVTDWLTQHSVEVLCVQETKVVDAEFPLAAIEALNYQAYFVGQKSYNGVALLSRSPLTAVEVGFAAVLGEAAAEFEAQKRVITAVLGDLRIVNLYVPNGSELGSEKYDYKLRWLAMLREYLAVLLTRSDKIVVCGDFNVALEDRDIYDPKGKEKHIMASPAERLALRQAVLALGFVDALRLFHSEGELFSWWDYRTAAFSRNRGWRIDHHYLSPALCDRAVDCTIDLEPRRLEKPSDHTPVVLELQD